MKRKITLLIAALLGTAYLIYLFTYFGGIGAGTDSAEAVGAGVAVALALPHMLFVGLAVIFNWLGWLMKLRWSALVAGILYAVSMLMMIIYAPFVLIQMILCFVGFARMKPKAE